MKVNKIIDIKIKNIEQRYKTIQSNIAQLSTEGVKLQGEHRALKDLKKTLTNKEQ